MNKNNLIEYEIKEYESEGLSFIKVVAKKKYFSVTLCDLGASIYDVFFLQRRMTLTPKYLSDFKRINIYHGKTIGRVANRIKDAKIVVDNITYNLDPNENGNTLHGGRNAISSKFFEYEIVENDEALSVIYRYKSPHLDAGFPEDVDIYVRYTFPKLFEIPCFYLVYDVDTERVTPIKLTNHTFWCLGDSSIRNMQIHLYSDRFIEVNKDDLLPTKITKLPNNGFDGDYLKGIIKEGLFEGGLDNYFYFHLPKNKQNYPPLIIKNDHTGMAIHTNYEGVQLYSDNMVDTTAFYHTKTMNHKALAIEPSDSHLSKGMIDKDHPYHRYIFYQFFYNGKE